VNVNNSRSAISLLLFIVPILNRADPLDTWTLRYPLPTQIPLRSVAYGAGEFVAVGHGITASADGVTWTRCQSNATNSLASVAYGNGRFVAAGNAGTVLSSTNGVEWVSGISPTEGDVTIIAYGAGQFVAAAQEVNPVTLQWEGTILTSKDGMNWVQRQSGTSYTISCIAYGNGQFVAFGSDNVQENAVTLLTSTDGVTWAQSQVLAPIGTRFGVNSAVYENGQFVAVGVAYTLDDCNCSTNVLVSTDGTNWSPVKHVGDNLLAVTYGGGRFVATGGTGTIVTSTDGVTWVTQRARDAGEGHWLSGLAYGANHFVAVGWGGGILTSTDGVTWTLQQRRRPYVLNCIAYGNGRFVALENGPSNVDADALISIDGADWAQTALETVNEAVGEVDHSVGASSVTFAEGTFAAVGRVDLDTFWIGSSTNGVNWVDRFLIWTGSRPQSGMAYGNGLFVTDGFMSSDAVNWQEQSGTADFLRAIAYGNGEFVALGWEFDPAISDMKLDALISTTGLSWTQGPTRWPKDAGRAVAFGGGTFVAVGDNGGILSSTDGMSWIQRESGTQTQLNGVAYGDNGFIAVGAAGTILTSADGVAWVQRSSGTNHDLDAAAYGNGHWVVVGQYGTILESGGLGHLALNHKPDTPGLELSVTGPAGSAYTIQTSTDLTSWRTLTNFTATANGEALLEVLPQGSLRLFYRASSP
jgi:hypothetical protein